MLVSEITPVIQREGTGNAIVSEAANSKIASSKGNGNTLDAQTNSFMSSRIGSDFSGVRIHANEEASQLNNELSAKAFTVGNNIYFGQGQYQPDTDSGKHLLAHELTHVVQQSNGGQTSKDIVQRTAHPGEYCQAFMELVRYEDEHGKAEVLLSYNGLNNDALIPLNRNIPSIHGDVDVDWMFRMSFMSILLSTQNYTLQSRYHAQLLAYFVAKLGWNIIRPLTGYYGEEVDYDLEIGSIIEPGNFNSSWAITLYVNTPITLRQLFAPAILACSNLER